MSQTKIDLFLHTDVETASLKSHTGKMYSLGAVATLFDYTIPDNCDSHFELTYLPTPDCWDSSTLDWAVKAYGQDFILKCLEEGTSDFRNIWRALASAFSNWIGHIEAQGYVVHLVCNHTDFDVTFLRVMYDKIDMPFPVKYNRIWDMPSLLVAHTRMDQYTALEKYGRPKEAVKHTALEDAIAQMEVLKSYGVYLPISSR